MKPTAFFCRKEKPQRFAAIQVENKRPPDTEGAGVECFKARVHLLSGTYISILMAGGGGFKSRSGVSQSSCFGPEGITMIPAPARGRTDEGLGSELNPACVPLSLVRS